MKYFLGFFIGVIVSALVLLYFVQQKPSRILSPITQFINRPLDKYTIDNLTTRQGIESKIVLDEAIATTSAYTAYTFHFTSDGKRVSGLAHVPAEAFANKDQPDSGSPFPVIVQFRGYIDHDTYTPGDGTRHSAEVFASNGFISLAPDFLGYGSSDEPSTDVFEERFETYTTALDLLASVSSLKQADSSRVGIWGHSNGGHIAITVSEISNRKYPLVLWALVSAPFPYSILYYSVDAPDKGKILRKELAEFESLYNVDLFSLTNYLDRLAGPVQIHQGGKDAAVPKSWTDDFVQKLKETNKTVSYYTYPDSNHDMSPDWNTVVERDLQFYQKYL
jgi:uncharacterized protein